MVYGWAYGMSYVKLLCPYHAIRSVIRQGIRMSYEILSYVMSVGPFLVIRHVIPLRSTMAESVIAMSYVRMTSAMTIIKIVIRKSYIRMTML
jgi:uncharacterized membrane protein YcgQ (UPF0703/DUF1980 family)